MPLEVEDGTGKTDADSYISAADGNAYLLAHYGSAEPFAISPDNADKDAVHRRARLALDSMYAPRLQGTRNTKAQALPWPRTGVVGRDGYAVDTDEVPVDWQYAQCELARRIYAGDDPIPDSERGGGLKREKIDVLEFEYMEGADSQPDLEQIDLLVAPYLVGGGSESVGQLVRA